LQFFTRLEADHPTHRDLGFFSSARIATYPALKRFDGEDAEAAQLDSLASHQRLLQRMEQGTEDLLGFCPGDARAVYQSVHEVLFNHAVGLRFLILERFSTATPRFSPNLTRLPARLTPLRRVCKTLLMEEFLLASSPREFLFAVNASARLVFKLTHLLLPFLLAFPAFGFGPGFGGTKPTSEFSGTAQKEPNSVSFR
jgi:hypothetical protein